MRPAAALGSALGWIEAAAAGHPPRLGTGAFAWGALAGLEVGLVGALLVALARQLMIAPTSGDGGDGGDGGGDGGDGGDGGPSRRLAVCLAAVALASPEAAVIAGVVA